MIRNRGAVVIIDGRKILLIKRVKKHEEYFVFPGGGIESGETPEEAAIREAKEELGVAVELKGCLSFINLNGMQYYFHAEITAGRIGEGKAAEFQDPCRGTYEPVWISIEEFPSIDIRPQEVAGKVQSLLELSLPEEGTLE
ncbi:NUDIX domain-containing protein [Rossellomorea vietnamensis]|uniref:NUDIX domain-containing protein n=1 Tax=Rossellomorea vietnamensis TaxID=218284 RepID=A0A5D4NXQ3_9BACI|nr:NUDIX domain-containing protein [Rossellomorea vietnamensis]TYS19115.1 NUDIX domain-containing protein [Rossellomorea vietnamensis]